MARIYKERRDFMVNELGNTSFPIVPPDGTFYAMLDASCLRAGTESAERLLTEYGIASVDGSCYGISAEGFVRLSLTKDEVKFKEACARLRKVGYGTQS